MYRVDFVPAAQRDLKRIQEPLRTRIVATIDSLRADPRPPGCRKLQGQPFWRIRVQDYRIIYQILDAQLLVTVIRVRHRRHVYR